MIAPTKSLPTNYVKSGTVSLHNAKDAIQMLFWSLVLPVLVIPLLIVVLNSTGQLEPALHILASSGPVRFLIGILLMTVVMVIVHEGLHGLVFWLTTQERPRFEFKIYYASASAGDWHLPRRPFMIATLLPLVGITLVGYALLLITGPFLSALLSLLIIFNASGAAGDLLVALRLIRQPADTLTHDTGSEVTFFSASKVKD